MSAQNRPPAIGGAGRGQVRQKELERILTAHRKAGVPIRRTEFDVHSGKMVIIVGEPSPAAEADERNPWDEVMKHDADQDRPA